MEENRTSGHDLVGHRQPGLVGRLPAARLVELWPRAVSRVVKSGFVVELADLDPPRTGIFDGLKIVIDPDVPFEMQCFVLLHLFGHSVQWTAPSLAAGLDDLRHTTDKAAFMKVLEAYEYQAARFGKQLLDETALDGLDRWYSDFVATDWKYVERSCGLSDQWRAAPLADFAQGDQPRRNYPARR